MMINSSFVRSDGQRTGRCRAFRPVRLVARLAGTVQLAEFQEPHSFPQSLGL